ncbi:hypothetical protein IL131_001823 [Neisseria gonorrhoeae]
MTESCGIGLGTSLKGGGGATVKMPSETQIIGFQTALAHQELRTSLRW